MIHSLHMSRVRSDFNPSRGKAEQGPCQGPSDTDTKGFALGGAGEDRIQTCPLFHRELVQRHHLELVYYMIYTLKQDPFKLVTVVSVQDND